MPDDSSADFRATQQKHALAIRLEDRLMRNLGMTREQARKALQQFSKVNQAVEQQRARDGAAKAAAWDKKVEVDEQKFNKGGGKINNEGGKVPANPIGVPQSLLSDVVYLDTSDDTLYKTNIYTDGRKDAV